MAPRLSVVVPIYNVEIYLEECLASLAAQDFSDFEVVMVDDGSSDGSAALARAFAERDPRFRLVEQENKGLGAARNTGVRATDPGSEYLAFVDSDDTLPPDAYQRLLDTLDSTGSDFAAGNVQMLRSAGLSPSAMHRKAFAETNLRTHISRSPELIADRTAWNKVFRRSFWDKHRLAWPEGVLFEDAPLTLPAHFRATAVDVLAEPVYHWRQREAGTPSITQDRTNPVGLRDRVKAIDDVSRFLAGEEKYRGKKDWFDQNALATEIPLYLNVLPRAGEEFRRTFTTSVTDFISRVNPAVLAKLPAPIRIKLHLVTEGRMDEVLALQKFEKDNPNSIPVKGVLGRLHADYPVVGDLPRQVTRLGSELAARARMYEAEWTDRGLRLTGHAYIRNLEAAKPRSSLRTLLLQGGGNRRPVLVPVRSTWCPDATATSGQTLHQYDWSGFEAVIDPEKLKKRGQWQFGSYRLTMAVLAKGRPTRTRIKAGPPGASPYLAPRYFDDGTVRVAPYLAEDHLYLRVEKVVARLTGHQQVGRDVELTARLAAEAAGAEKASLRLTHRQSKKVLEFPAQVTGDRLTVLVRTEQLDEAGSATRRSVNESGDWGHDHWTAEVLLPGRKATPLVMELSVAGAQYTRSAVDEADRHPDALVVGRNATEQLTLRNGPAQPMATAAAWTDAGELELSGAYPVPEGDLELVLRHSRHAEEHIYPLERDGERFSARFAPVPHSLAGNVPLRWGNWFAFVRPKGELDDNRYAPVRVATALHPSLPATAEVRGRRMLLDRRYFDRLAIESLQELDATELGAYHQRRLRDSFYPAARTEQPLREAVLYDTFSGRQVSDSPRAVFAELRRQGRDLEHLWVVRDLQCEVPEGATAVPVNSKAWYEALATSRFLVVNSHQPHWFRRREGQVVVQTWHGTPLKRIGHDIDSVQFADLEYLDKVAEETPNWSFLVSPNTFSTPILRRAFRYEGEILESGYPRNDLLHADDREEQARRIRERIGIPAGKKVVLYAPTWRDDQFYGQGRYKLDFRIDVPEAAAELGDDHVLLVRKHANIVDTVPGAGDGFVFDVSSYPEIAELFLIADVLVTDYSSLMFDFATTGKPMFFYTYDLEHYRGNLRGFYFDFEAQAPGPLLGTSAELVAAIRDADGVAKRYADAYASFRATFCDLDDGKAAQRVIDRMYELS
ncbi:bifunctional glycosyltransferase/CDP-glycerol:glycerophosphate glycerophosphotransferase [Streptacidiphilus monticola]|uniref:CDP-glycerol glycerophosphotransferase family protein n=1 Tax=Streptacidiphilus monticola TaxID=2161674 RepID=A0ABW1G0B3_9ACTN